MERSQEMKSMLRTLFLIAAIGGGAAAAGLTGATRAALADPPDGGQASCWGYEASDASPPGSESGTFSQYGMPGILAFTDIGVEALGLKNRGAIISMFAKAHEGSHEACDEFFDVPPE
jgi:hypothetical protein